MSLPHEQYYCRLCQGGEGQDEAYALAREYAASLPQEQCVTEDEYGQRLAACGLCPHLALGRTCSLCGCFIVARAKKRAQGCPDPEGSRWARGNLQAGKGIQV